MEATWKTRLPLLMIIYIVYCFAKDIVRLVDSNGEDSKSAEGRVEFYFNGSWGGICFNDFMKPDGGVVCRHLNFLGLDTFAFANDYNYTEHHDKQISCYGHEEDLNKCEKVSIFEWGSYECKKSVLYISCHTNLTVDRNPKVRLVGGDGSYGKVESFISGSWQTVCGEDWGKLEGGVVCRELGFRGVVLVTNDSKSVVTSGGMRYACNGHELSLEACSTSDESDISSYGMFEFSGDELSDSAAEISCLVSVDVTCLRDMDESVYAAEFLLPNSVRTFERKVGENLTLQCNATNSAEVWWLHRTWSNQTLAGTTPVLHLTNISVEDQGIYICVAKGLRGQEVEIVAAQTLIITDYVQLLLHVSIGTSDNITAISTLYDKLGYEVDIKKWDDRNFTLKLGKSLTENTTYTTILKEIDAGGTKWRGLSFCSGEEVEVNEVGILSFPSTNINSNAESIEKCVASNTPRASRGCVGDLITAAIWQDTNLRNCFNPTENSTANIQQLVEDFFSTVDQDNVTSENVSYVSRDLADVTAVEKVAEQSIYNVTNALRKITNVGSPSPTVTSNVVETVDNVLSKVSRKESILNAQTSSSIVTSLEQQLDAAKRGGSNISLLRSNIAVEVAQLKDTHSPVKLEYFSNHSHAETELNRNNSDPEQEKHLQVSVEIPANVLRDLSENCTLKDKGSFPVSFTIFSNGALFNDLRTTRERNSLIVSTSMLCEVPHLPNGNSISTHFTPIKEKDDPWECVYWESDLYGDENEAGGWSPEGCIDCHNKVSSTVTSEDPVTKYKCSWTHLTSFAVLLDVKGDSGKKALHIITIVGCVTSIVSLLITITTYLSIKKFRSSKPKQITLMLCAALLGLYLCFLVGIDRTENNTVCVIFGGLIHFFCLSSLSWMSIEATQLYLLLVKIMNAQVRKFMLKASVIAWGIPLVVVAVFVAVDSSAYADADNHNYCFPVHSSYAFYIGVLGLAALLMAYNIVLYIRIVWSISASRKNLNSSQTNRNGLLRRLQNALAISSLLGLSWVFGFLAIGNVRMVFNVLFCLTNSFQGLLIFLLFCLRQKEIREALRDWLTISTQLESRDEVLTELQKPNSASTSKQLTSESDVVNTSLSKTIEKSENV